MDCLLRKLIYGYDRDFQTNTRYYCIETSELYDGLFPSILDPQTGKMFLNRLPEIAGQRDGDWSHLGCNLIHDKPLLQTM